MAGRRTSLPARVHAWLWPATPPATAAGRAVLPALRMVYAVARDLAGGQLTLRAMSLVYTTLLSLVPLLALSFSILKGFGVHNEIGPFLLKALEPLGERAGEVAEQIIRFVDNMQVGVLGLSVVGLVLLFYTVHSLMQKIESAFNEVWQVTHERRLAQRLRDYLSLLVMGPVLVYAALGIVAAVFASHYIQDLRPIEPIGLLIDYLGRLAPFVMTIAAFTLIYRLVPNTRVRWLPALTGGVVAGVLWSLLGFAFAAFVASTTSYAAIYSGFATPIFFMIWLYLAWLVLLLGASIAFYMQHPEYLGGRQVAATFSIRDRERMALHAIYVIGERYYDAQPAVAAEELALELKIPTNVAVAMLTALTDAGLVAPTEEEPVRFLPARSWEKATLADALQAIRGARTARAVYTGAPVRRVAVEHALAALDRATSETFGRTTLQEFATDATDLPLRAPVEIVNKRESQP
jgi:membrane protein